MRVNFWIAIIIALAIGLVGGWMIGSTSATRPTGQIATTNSAKAQNLRTDMRKLWEDHIIWTRMYIISAVNNHPDKDQTLARLLKNQEDLGNAIKTYYGEEAGNKLTALFKDHISSAGEVVQAAATQNDSALQEANIKWYDNANQIADFLSQANPNFPQDQMRAMMKEHLDLTKQEAVDIINQQEDASIAGYDKVHDQILKMADMLSEGITRQFPDKF